MRPCVAEWQIKEPWTLLDSHIYCFFTELALCNFYFGLHVLTFNVSGHEVKWNPVAWLSSESNLRVAEFLYVSVELLCADVEASAQRQMCVLTPYISQCSSVRSPFISSSEGPLGAPAPLCNAASPQSRVCLLQRYQGHMLKLAPLWTWTVCF